MRLGPIGFDRSVQAAGADPAAQLTAARWADAPPPAPLETVLADARESHQQARRARRDQQCGQVRVESHT